MYILNSNQLSEVDQSTIKNKGISSWQLMETAALQAEKEILNYLTKSTSTIHVFCGVGNNGGDGLAIAYHLHQKGYNLNVYKVAYAENSSKDFIINQNRLHDETSIQLQIIDEHCLNSFVFSENEIVIDAIFGVGLNRKMPNFVTHLIQQLNEAKALRIAIDVPSGMFIHQATPKDSSIFKADVCLTFELPKLAFLLPETGKFIKEWKLIPIGLNREAILQQTTKYIYIDAALAMQIHQPRQRFSHKGTYGNALLVGGKAGMIGSILLSSKAALRSGVGKLMVMLPTSGHVNLHHFIPEAMALPHQEDGQITYVEAQGYQSIGIGMGMGTDHQATEAFKHFLTHADSPILVDADGINLLSLHKEYIQLLPPQSILTPHPGELKRLIGNWNTDFEKLEKTQQFAKKHQLIIVAKDAVTCICDGKQFYFNSTGNAGMATAGSGDVLSGMITALMSQAYTPLEAAQLGVFVHGLAGDIALQTESMESLLASDLIANIGKAFQKIASKEV